MPIERDRYPQNWEEITLQLKHNANWSCQHCGQSCRKNGESIEDFLKRTFIPNSPEWHDAKEHPQKYCLTGAHLDQNPSNNKTENLAALCTLCHLKHDRPFQTRNSYAKLERRGQIPIDFSVQLSLHKYI